MKIVHFLPGRVSLESSNGVEKTVYFLSKAQAGLGHEVRLLSLTSKPVRPIPGVQVSAYAAGYSPFSIPSGLIKTLRAFGPDVVHLHSAYVPSNVGLGRKLRMLGIPYVLTAHGNYSRKLLKRRPWLKIPYRYFLELPLANRALFVHAIADKQAIVDFGVRRPIVSAPNGIDPMVATKAIAGNPFVQRWPELAGREICLFLGRLDIEQKGLDILIDGFAYALKEDKRLALAVVGPSWKGGKRKLANHVSRHGLGESVRFWGAAGPEVKFRLIHNSRMFLHPSRWEAGVPFSVLEALACGKPCIVSRAADPENRIHANAAGFHTSNTARDIAANILAVSKMLPSEAIEMEESAARLIRKHFSWERTAFILCDAVQAMIPEQTTSARSDEKLSETKD